MNLSDKLASAVDQAEAMRLAGELPGEAATHFSAFLRRCAVEASALESICGLRSMRGIQRPGFAPGNDFHDAARQLAAAPDCLSALGLRPTRGPAFTVARRRPCAAPRRALRALRWPCAGEVLAVICGVVAAVITLLLGAMLGLA